MPKSLNKETFLMLTTLAWSDGLADEEKQGLLQAANDAGLQEPDLAELKQALEAPSSTQQYPVTNMDRFQKVMTYALAAWLVRIDKVVTPEERDSLNVLGNQLALPDGIRTQASAAAFQIGELPGEERPNRFDFKGLQKLILEKLPNLETSSDE
jgi:uncharacterized membrane protein YebE (DUF533 family)